MTIQMLRPRAFVPAQPDPVKGTLLDAATVLEGLAWMDTEGLFESYNCLPTDTITAWPCPAPSLLAPPVQAAAGTATTGGTLAAGTYRSVVTALNSRGETLASNEISRVTTGATSTITFNWADVSGETGYRVYVTAVGGATGTETLLVELPAGTTTYTWTGTPARGVNVPPTTSTAGVVTSKTFGSPAWQDGLKFAVQSGVICKAVGFDVPNAEAELARAFENKESVGVARALLQTRFIASSGNWLAATDITPAAGAVDPAVGVALLEGHAGAIYAGAPTFHVGRTIGSLMTKNGALIWDGNILRTVLKSKVAADSGYEYPNSSPTGAAPATGEQWIYATGEVTVARSEPVQKMVPNTSTNEISILRERMYIAAVDCYAAAVRVKVQ